MFLAFGGLWGLTILLGRVFLEKKKVPVSWRKKRDLVVFEELSMLLMEQLMLVCFSNKKGINGLSLESE